MTRIGYMTNRQKQNKLKKIEQLKKALRDDKKMWGGWRDGRGLRYAIAEEYFKLADYKLSNRYLNWFNKNFADDYTYGYFQFGAAITRYKVKKLNEAKAHLIDVNRHNTYLLDLIIGKEISDQNKYEWNESEGLDYAKIHLSDYHELLDEDTMDWIKNTKEDRQYQDNYNRYIAIKRQVKEYEGFSAERTNLLNEERKCIDQWAKVYSRT